MKCCTYSVKYWLLCYYFIPSGYLYKTSCYSPVDFLLPPLHVYSIQCTVSGVGSYHVCAGGVHTGKNIYDP